MNSSALEGINIAIIRHSERGTGNLLLPVVAVQIIFILLSDGRT